MPIGLLKRSLTIRKHLLGGKSMLRSWKMLILLLLLCKPLLVMAQDEPAWDFLVAVTGPVVTFYTDRPANATTDCGTIVSLSDQLKTFVADPELNGGIAVVNFTDPATGLGALIGLKVIQSPMSFDPSDMSLGENPETTGCDDEFPMTFCPITPYVFTHCNQQLVISSVYCMPTYGDSPIQVGIVDSFGNYTAAALQAPKSAAAQTPQKPRTLCKVKPLSPPPTEPCYAARRAETWSKVVLTRVGKPDPPVKKGFFTVTMTAEAAAALSQYGCTVDYSVKVSQTVTFPMWEITYHFKKTCYHTIWQCQYGKWVPLQVQLCVRFCDKVLYEPDELNYYFYGYSSKSQQFRDDSNMSCGPWIIHNLGPVIN